MSMAPPVLSVIKISHPSSQMCAAASRDGKEQLALSLFASIAPMALACLLRSVVVIRGGPVLVVTPLFAQVPQTTALGTESASQLITASATVAGPELLVTPLCV